jgi:glycosyltransferase involved in cell wall biosynthesis
LWEDNLPQVAIECVASGVPILTSNRGGAQELLDCRDLVFQAGSRADFYTKLQGILDNPDILSVALAGRARLFTTREHYDLLREKYYLGTMSGAASRSIEKVPVHG